jgi:large subunit ribosomal protein L20
VKLGLQFTVYSLQRLFKRMLISYAVNCTLFAVNSQTPACPRLRREASRLAGSEGEMSRVKTNVARRKRIKKVLRRAKGQWGDRSKQYLQAKRSLLHSDTYAYRDRKKRKIEFRQLWISRINAGVRAAGMTYNRFINGLKKAKVNLDRKMLAELAVNEPKAFAKLIEIAKG